MLSLMNQIYPSELVLVPDSTDGSNCPFLDLNLTLTDGVITTSVFDKRDTFNFQIVNFPNLSGNIPSRASSGVFIGELVRYARACSFLEDFQERTKILLKKLTKQYFSIRSLSKQYTKFTYKHIFKIQKYGKDILSCPTI